MHVKFIEQIEHSLAFIKTSQSTYKPEISNAEISNAKSKTFFNLTQRSRSKSRRIEDGLITISLWFDNIITKSISQQFRNNPSRGQHFRLKKFGDWSSDRSILGNRDAIRIHSSRYGES